MPSGFRIIPDVVQGQTVCAMQATGTALEAARRMDFFNIGAVVVVDNVGRLTGIVTERDITRRIVAEGRDPAAVPVGDIMTRDPDTLAPEDSAADALERMRLQGYRHLPVIDRGRVIGIVSVRDLYEVIKLELERAIELDRGTAQPLRDSGG